MTAGHTVTPNPRLTTEQAAQVALRHWGVVGSVTDVGSLEDQNLRLTGADGASFVLKVAAAGTPGERLTMQNAAMRHFAARAEAILGPVPLAAGDGRDVVADGGWTARLLTWVDGTLLSDGPLGNRRPQEALGAFAARVTKAMADFEHPGLDVPSTWDVCRSRVVVESLAGAMEPSRRELALACLAGFDAVVASTGDLPAQAVHTDVTDVNVVAAPGGWWPAPVGVLDFGDTVRTVRVADVVGTALCVAERPDVLDPLAGVAAVLTGYVRVLPLEEKEIDSVWPLLLARAAVNLAMCDVQTAATADNDYAREELERAAGGCRDLLAVPAPVAVATLRAVAGFNPVPSARAAAEALTAASPVPVLEPDLSGSLTLDLSVDSDLWTAGEWASTGATRALLPSGGFLVGRWGEARLTDSGGPGPLAPANLHLGADLFVPVGIPVRSPLMARVRSTSGEDITLDLRPAGVALDLRLTGIRVDRSVVAGDVVSPGAGLGTVAAAAAGDLGAHLHVQLLADPALPPLGRPAERDAWLALCPDPSALIGHSVAAPQVVPAERIRDERAAHVADPQHLYYEDALEVVRGWRHVMYDSDGRAYLDMINNIATVGHSHPRVTEAATRQFRRLNTNSRFLYTSMTRYADRVAELLPPELDSIFLVNSGSEAADLALQLARQRTGRRDVLALEAAYHGWTGAVIDLSTSPNDRPNWRTELQPHIHIVDQPNPYRGKHGALPDGYVASVAAACERAAGAGGPAAFVSEPLLGNQGAVEPPVGFLARAYETVRAAGGLCIADEVQVGMARTGTFWAFEHEGVVPDIVYTAKATGNGHPLGVVACRREIADAFNARTAYFSSTGGGPVSCEVGIAVLDVIRDEDLVHHARVVGGRLKAELSALAGRHPLVGAVHGRGLFLGVDLVADPVTKAPATLDADRVSELLRDRGIIMQPTGDALNVLKVKPPLCIDDEAAAYFLTHLDAVLGEIERWPGR